MEDVVFKAALGILGAFIGTLATLFVKQKARDVLREELGLHLSQFEIKIISILDKKYKLTNECTIQHTDLLDRVSALEEKTDLIDLLNTDVAVIKSQIDEIRHKL